MVSFDLNGAIYDVTGRGIFGGNGSTVIGALAGEIANLTLTDGTLRSNNDVDVAAEFGNTAFVTVGADATWDVDDRLRLGPLRLGRPLHPRRGNRHLRACFARRLLDSQRPERP